MKLEIWHLDKMARLIRHKLVTGRDILTKEETAFELSTPVDFTSETRKIEDNYWIINIGGKSFKVVYNPKIAQFEVSQRFIEPKESFLKISNEYLEPLGG